jgi:uncharacterized protein DUF1353
MTLTCYLHFRRSIHDLLLSATRVALGTLLVLPVSAELSPTPSPTPTPHPPLDPWGYFEGRVETSRPKRGDPDFDPNWPEWQEILLRDFQYVDRHNTRWIAPKGDRLDGASIPKFLWGWLVGDPLIGPYFEASILHDAYCYRKAQGLPGKERDWSAIHRMFYEAMRCGGTGQFEAQTKYFAVRKFGPPHDRSIWQRLFGSPDKPAKTIPRGPAAQLLSRAKLFLTDSEVANFFASMTESRDSKTPESVAFQVPPDAQLVAAVRLARQIEWSMTRWSSTVTTTTTSATTTTTTGTTTTTTTTSSPPERSATPSFATPRPVSIPPESLVSGSVYVALTDAEQEKILEEIIYIAKRSDRLSLDEIDRLAESGVPDVP